VIYLDDGFFAHPKVIAAGDEATMLYLRGLGWLKQQGSTDGRIPKIVLPVIAPNAKGKPITGRTLTGLTDRLVDVVMWHDDDTHWTVHGYVERNQKAIDKSQQARDAARKRHANAQRTQKRPQSERISETDADADASAVRSLCHSPQPTDTAHSPQPTDTSTSSSSSSNGSTPVAPPGGEEEDPRIHQALETLAHRALATRTGPPVTDRKAWLTRVTTERHLEHADRARHLLVVEPDLTGDQLADLLDPDPDDADHAAYLASLQTTPEELAERAHADQARAFQASPEGAAAREQVRQQLNALRGGQ
jgi:hypothetical protein